MLLLIVNEDGSVFAVIYERHRGRMLYACADILGPSRAEEALHDVFLHLIERYQGDFSELLDKPAVFFVVAARNHSLNLLRREHGALSLPEDESVFREDGDPETAVMEKEDEDALVGLIRALKPAMRQVLEYKYILGYTNKEIAQALGVSESVVSSRLTRARKELKKRLEAKEAERDG